jgi:hypothetical protein
VAFYVKSIKGNALFYASILVELVVVYLFWKSAVGYIWLVPIGAVGVMVFGWLFQIMIAKKVQSSEFKVQS